MSDDSRLPAETPGAQDVALLAAALRADAGDLESYGRVLVSSLEGSLPAGCLEIERDRSLGDRVAGRPGAVRSIRIHLGEVTLELASVRSRLIGTLARSVRGVAISRKELPLAEWSMAFAEALALFAKENAEAREALSRLLGAS